MPPPAGVLLGERRRLGQWDSYAKRYNNEWDAMRSNLPRKEFCATRGWPTKTQRGQSGEADSFRAQHQYQGRRAYVSRADRGPRRVARFDRYDGVLPGARAAPADE